MFRSMVLNIFETIRPGDNQRPYRVIGYPNPIKLIRGIGIGISVCIGKHYMLCKETYIYTIFLCT